VIYDLLDSILIGLAHSTYSAAHSTYSAAHSTYSAAGDSSDGDVASVGEVGDKAVFF